MAKAQQRNGTDREVWGGITSNEFKSKRTTGHNPTKHAKRVFGKSSEPDLHTQRSIGFGSSLLNTSGCRLPLNKKQLMDRSAIIFKSNDKTVRVNTAP